MTDDCPDSDAETPAEPPTPSPVVVPPTVYGQLTALRDAGVANMTTQVVRALHRFEFDAAADWIQAHPERYWRGLTDGFKPTDPAAVPAVDSDALREAVADTTDPVSPCVEPTTHAEHKLVNALYDDQGLIPAASRYATDGTWREIAPFTNAEQAAIDRLTQAVPCQSQRCQRNAQLAALVGDDNDLDVAYVEGYAVVETMLVPVQHAWIELNGKVVELTFPEDPDPDTAAYLGVSYDIETVRRQVAATETAQFLAD